MFSSALPLVEDGVTSQQFGEDKVEFPCLNSLISYYQYMGDVDLVDFNEKMVGDLQQTEDLRNGTNMDFLVY